jgi:ribosomal protein L40E
VFIFFTAALTLPSSRVGVVLLVTLAPAAGFIFAMAERRKPGAPGVFTLPRRFTPSGETMQGQPHPRSVLKSKMMAARFAAGMPRDAGYVARLSFVSGLEGIETKPVDLFLGGGSLWVAPLKPGAAPVPIALRDVLRVDVWPEGDAPPTLRVSWSPPAGELTRELVLGAIPEVPPPLVGRQLGAIAGAVTDAMQHDEKAALAARREPAAPLLPSVELCARCGEELPDGATRCPHCGTAR